MIKPIGLSAIPTPNFLEVRSRNNFGMNLRSTRASYEYANKPGAQITARIIMVDIMERIADGNIANVDGWQFRHHDELTDEPIDGLLPNNAGFSITPPTQGRIRLEAAEAAIQLRDALSDASQRNYRPDYVAISAPKVKQATTHLDPRQHELRIVWGPEEDGSQFSAVILVWSPLDEDENITPFFTLDSLRAYVGLK